MRPQTWRQLEDRATVLLIDFALGVVRTQTKQGLTDLVAVLGAGRARLRLEAAFGVEVERIAHDTGDHAAPVRTKEDR